LETVLKNSLERQLHADVPLGLFLSSGIDSSLLAALVNKYFASKQGFNFFTVCFEQATASDESRDAISFISGFKNPNLHSHKLHVNASYVREHIHHLYKYFDEPFGDHASLLNWVISKKARDYVAVAISGDGADELFWGYPRYNRWRHITQVNNLPFLPNIAGALSKILPPSFSKYKLISASERNGARRHLNQFLPNGMRFLLTDHISSHPIWALKGSSDLEGREDLPSVLDLKTYLADGMLYKVDRASMASSLEVRVPFLDNEVVDFALSLSFIEKSNKQFQNKALLKLLLMKLAPHYNINLPKRGFNFPLYQWLYNDWRDEVLSIVTDDMLNSFELNSKIFMQIVNDFYREKANYTDAVWYLYNLGLWKNSFDSIIKEV
jgi:asparagine synthase (glutamine-hydrolysing)